MCVENGYAILEGNWEGQSRGDVELIRPGLYDELEAQARSELGITGDRNKPLVARFIAEALAQQGHVPKLVNDILAKVRQPVPDTTDQGNARQQA